MRWTVVRVDCRGVQTCDAAGGHAAAAVAATANAPAAAPRKAEPAAHDAMQAASARLAGDEAATLDDIERLPEATEEKTAVTEDLIVRDGRVYCASGAAFRGALTRKQIHLLRTVGRIVARTMSRTSKDFVRMPSKV